MKKLLLAVSAFASLGIVPTQAQAAMIIGGGQQKTGAAGMDRAIARGMFSTSAIYSVKADASSLNGDFTVLGSSNDGVYVLGSARTMIMSNTPAQTSAVPEPATWAMMLIGFGVLGTTMRRRRPAMRRAFA